MLPVAANDRKRQDGFRDPIFLIWAEKQGFYVHKRPNPHMFKRQIDEGISQPN
jgi:hypothetical protein